MVSFPELTQDRFFLLCGFVRIEILVYGLCKFKGAFGLGETNKIFNVNQACGGLSETSGRQCRAVRLVAFLSALTDKPPGPLPSRQVPAAPQPFPFAALVGCKGTNLAWQARLVREGVEQVNCGAPLTVVVKWGSDHVGWAEWISIAVAPKLANIRILGGLKKDRFLGPA